MACYVEITGVMGGPEYGSVELLPDGGARVVTGSTPYGQGHVTAWSMLVQDRTGIPMDRVEVVYGDTDLVPSSEVTGGSRSLQIAGSAVHQAAGTLVELATERAAELLEASPHDVVLDAESGRFHVVGSPAVSVGWADVGAGLGDDVLLAVSDFSAAGPTFPFGAHVAVVEVDADTGRVELLRLVACDDAGVILNPLLVDGQVHGGLAQGAAQALFEQVVYDADGNPLTTTFADYAIPSAAELPELRAGADGDAHPGQPARGQGHRRVGHHRRHAGGAERGGRRPRPPRRAPPRPAADPRAGLAGHHLRRRLRPEARSLARHPASGGDPASSATRDPHQNGIGELAEVRRPRRPGP